MKKLLSLLLVTMLLVGILGACSNDKKTEDDSKAKAETETKTDDKKENDTEKKVKIAFASNSYSDKWQTYLNDAARAKCEELGVEVIFSDGKDDSATQLNNVETALADGVQAVLIVMVDPSAPAPFINACKTANVPLIAVNRFFEGAEVFVGSDDINAGNIQAEYVSKKIGDKGNIAILQGMLGQDSVAKRTEGNMQIIEQKPDMKVIFQETGKWDRAKGMEITENWLSSGEEINAIISNNDEMAIGAINAIKAAGKLGEITVAGVDATIDALEYVKNGELDVTVFQNPFGQGGQAVVSAIDLINGKEVKGYIDVPFEEVTKDNVDKYIEIWNK